MSSIPTLFGTPGKNLYTLMQNSFGIICDGARTSGNKVTNVTWSIRPTFVVYCVALISTIGWFFFCVFAGFGIGEQEGAAVVGRSIAGVWRRPCRVKQTRRWGVSLEVGCRGRMSRACSGRPVCFRLAVLMPVDMMRRFKQMPKTVISKAEYVKRARDLALRQERQRLLNLSLPPPLLSSRDWSHPHPSLPGIRRAKKIKETGRALSHERLQGVKGRKWRRQFLELQRQVTILEEDNEKLLEEYPQASCPCPCRRPCRCRRPCTCRRPCPCRRCPCTCRCLRRLALLGLGDLVEVTGTPMAFLT